MRDKVTNLIFIVTFLTVVHHLYAGNLINPRHDDRQNEEGSSGNDVPQDKRIEILK